MQPLSLKSVRLHIALVAIAAGLALAPCVNCAAQDTHQSASPAGVEAQAPEAAEAPSLHETDIPALAGLKVEGEKAAASPARREASPSGRALAPSGQNGGLSYTVRPGDSLSTIAQLYGLELSELVHTNHLGEDSVLRAGQTLQIPNPFAAQVRHLQATVQQLSTDAESARHQQQMDQAKIQTLSDRVEQLRAANQELEHGVRVLPWWRGLGLTAGAAALLMLGVTALTMLEWLLLRRRFRSLVEMNEAIRRLDQKYRVALAKAELRLQQLYGRRRAIPEDQDKSKPPEQIEIDRLNQQLKELLQEHLEKLGLPAEKAGRRGRLRDLLGGVESESPVEARAGRR